ncbi:MAG: aminoacyl-tRNA hydrolase, partial [Clostridium sp.]
DDVSLEVGQVRIRKKGSAGGHNGLKNIIAQLGNDTFLRIKMGVGEKPKGYDLADYVLGHFTKEERAVMDQSGHQACEAVKLMIADKTDEAMNRYNKKITKQETE